MLAAHRSKDYWKWRMLGVFHLFLFFFWGISHIRAFLQVDDFFFFFFLYMYSVGVGLGCISYSWPLIFLQVSIGVICCIYLDFWSCPMSLNITYMAT